MVEGRHSAPRGRSNKSEEAKKRALANEQRLLALGEAVDRRSGVKRKEPKAKGPKRRKRVAILSAIVVVGLLALLIGGGYFYGIYRFSLIHKISVANEIPVISGKPFNILEVGSDSRVGLTGILAKRTGASTGQAAGQRSDVVKVMHVDPTARTITVLSIPRDTTVTLLANQALYGKFNRINVNYAGGPSLLAETITANFGIPINHVIQVSFGGLINAAEAIGGVRLDFPYPAHDTYSGLRINHAGCQLVTGFQALAVARSRHFYYNVKHNGVWPKNAINMSYGQLAALGWVYDGTSDYGRIDRQNAFIRAMISRVKGLYNPLSINSFLSKIPEGVTLDSNFTFNELIGLAYRFHSFNPAAMQSFTMPTTGATVHGQDLLFVNQPAAQRLMVNIFGSDLLAPTNPPPNEKFATPMPPVIAPTTTTTTIATSTSTKKKHPTTTTTNPSPVSPTFDPVPCAK
jgi:LCP family protein required for cell wall assembly